MEDNDDSYDEEYEEGKEQEQILQKRIDNKKCCMTAAFFIVNYVIGDGIRFRRTPLNVLRLQT